MKLGVFAMIPQLNAKVPNGSHQHHQKAKKFVFKSQKWRQCLCFYDSKGIIHHEFVPEGQTVTGSFYLSVLECLWKRFCRVWPEYSASSSCCTRIFSPTPLIYPPVIISCSPNWSYHWKGASLKMFKTSKELWHRVFRPYHKKTCRGHSVFARSCHLLYRCRRDVLWIKYR